MKSKRSPVSRIGKLWKMAYFIEATGEEVRNAQKPYDLEFPRWRLINLSIKARVMLYEWLEEKMKLDKRDRGRWPHL